MASLQKTDSKAEMKLEPKEQREPKKSLIGQPPSSKPTANLSNEKKDVIKEAIAVKKESQSSNKTSEPTKGTTDQNSLDKKDSKEVSKKETQNVTKPSEQSKPPADQKQKIDVKTEKKDTVGVVKIGEQKVLDVRPSSPSKSSVKKSTNGKLSSESLSISNKIQSSPLPQINQEKVKINIGNSGIKDVTSQEKVSTNNGNGDGSSPSETDKKNAKEVIDVSTEDAEKAQDVPANKEAGKTDSSQKQKDSLVKVSQPTSKPETSDNAHKVLSANPKLSESEDTVKMSGDKNNNETDKTSKPKEEQPVSKTEENEKSPSSKFQLRSQIWNKMLRSSALAYRKPCNYRIPHFKGDVISAGRLTTMELFQNAKVVKVSLDKAHECVRLQAIEAGKEIIVGCPGLREAVFLHVKPPMEPSKSSNKLASSRIGIGHIGSALDFSGGIQADLVIVGSVAVDKTGLRVGKGEGFADLEYALLKKLGGIAPDAPIITVVHDSQVYDTLPEDMFKEHDVPADYIVTPTQVIEITPKRKHPDLIWNILSNRRVNSIPIIKQLLDREQNREGVTISLKEEDTDNEDLEEIAKRKRYFMRRRTYSNSSQRGRRPLTNRNNMVNMRGGRIRRHTAPSERGYQDNNMMPASPRVTRTFRNRVPSISRNNYPIDTKQNGFRVTRNYQKGGRRMNNFRQMFRPKYSVDFSLKVQGLTNGIRVRDLKEAVTQRGIRPRDISWLPHKGVAFLHFSKPKKVVEETLLPPDTNSILATLKDLTIKGENGPETNLKVEPAQPFRRVHFTV